MAFPYKNPISLVTINAPEGIARTSTQGTNFSISQVGGFQEVYYLDNLKLYFSGTGLQSSEQNKIPIQINIGTNTGLTWTTLSLNSDNISSGRRKLGMLVYVHETETVYQYYIPNYETLWAGLTGLTGISAITQQDTVTTVNARSQQGQDFINAWTASTIEGYDSDRANARWRIFPLDVYITGGTFYSASTTLELANSTGGSIFISGFTSSSVTGGTFDSNLATLTLYNSDGSDVVITGFTGYATSSILQVSDGTTTVSPVTGITFDGATVTNDGFGNITVTITGGTGGTGGVSGSSGTSGTSGVSGSSGTSGTSGVSGSSGTSGTSGVSGSSGTSGTSGVSGSSGTSGTSGTGFTTVQNPALTRVLTSDGTPDGAIAESGLTYDFSSKTLSVSGAIQFETGTTATDAVAKLRWNNDDGGLTVGMRGGNVNLQVGQENLVLVYNDDNVTLTDGMVVYVYNSQGNRPAVKRAIATGETTSHTVIGVVTETIGVGDEGFITTFGLVNNLNTLGLTGGTPLYLSETVLGGYQENKPMAPNHTVLIGYVVRVSATVGSIYVHVEGGWELDELHDVRISGLTNGDILVYNQDELVWENTRQLTGDYIISGDTIQYGNEYTRSIYVTGITSGDTTIQSINCLSGSSIVFDYYVSESGGAKRAGTVITVFDCSNSEYTDYSTTDLGGTTLPLSFYTEVSGGNLNLVASVESGTWEIKLSTRIVF